jgi:fibro-slime domain-containing protein
MRRFVPVAVVLVAVASAACSVETHRGEVGIYQTPASASSGGSATMPDETPPTSFFLTMYLRDFRRYVATDPSTNPDFADRNSEVGVVDPSLGTDRKPVYRTPANTTPTFGQAAFDQWYRDTPGTNYTVGYPLPMSLNAEGLYEYDSQKSGQPDVYQGVARRVFFPLDDGDPYATPFGNQGQPHNLKFTAELHASFTAAPGATIAVRADDDAYLFVNDQLVVDLGGTHSALLRELNLDDLALTVGEKYSVDLFYAERQGATGDLMLRSNLELSAVILQ